MPDDSTPPPDDFLALDGADVAPSDEDIHQDVDPVEGSVS